jgi:hypothetical protein
LRRESNSTITFFSTQSSADPVLTTRRIGRRQAFGLMAGKAAAADAWPGDRCV